MHIRLPLLAAFLAVPLLAHPALAQTSPTQTLDPGTLDLAKQLVGKTAGEKEQVLTGMSTPMIGFMQQMGVRDPTKARELVDEAIMPLLREHYDELVEIQARSYAEALSVDDLKATLAFYDTKAGQDLIKAQPVLAQTRVTGMTQWMGTLQPEMQARVAKTAKAHGWTNGTP